MKGFDEVLEETEGGNRHLLLGNGYSQSLDGNIFSYQNLLERADFGSRNEAIKEIFTKLETYDFEAVIRTMISSICVAQSFNEYPAFVQGIRNDAEKLKNTLVSTITETHPNIPSDIQDHQYIATRTFLSKFVNIFTVNYDLLLYWARNRQNLAPVGFNTDDGFRQNQVWVGSCTRQNIFFLHGGLHLFDESGVIKKHAYMGDGETIIDQVRDNLILNKFPIFVAEPTFKKKLDRILHNPYLNYCYESLGNITGNLIIYGHSMDETDTHVFDQICSSGINRVYISIYGDPHSPNNRRTKANSESYFHNCEVYFYRAETASVWG